MNRTNRIMLGTTIGLAITLLLLAPSIAGYAQTRGLLWHVDYFSNKDLQGNPVFSRDIPVINNYWANYSPDAALPPDNYSGRWNASGHFDAGTYRFTLAGNDGLRLYVDNALVIDQWHDQPFSSFTVDMSLSDGTHELRVEHYDSVHLAQIQFSFGAISGNGLSPVGAGTLQAKVVDFLRLRTGPGLGFGVEGIVDWGTTVSVLGRTADGFWIKVQTGNQIGWIYTPYTRFVSGGLAEVPVLPRIGQ